MKHPGKTPPFRGPRGEAVPGSIAEIKYLQLGDVDQLVMIQGDNVGNPPLILLHGGPGMSEWISELSAFGSPVRPLMVTAILAHGGFERINAYAYFAWLVDRTNELYSGHAILREGSA